MPPSDEAGPQEVVELDLTAMAHGGAALGRAADGRVVFVAGGLPGEHVRAEVVSAGARHAHGELAAVVGEPAGARVEVPACPHFGQWPGRGRHPESACGGCQWQHAAYDAQVAYKRAVAADALTRIGGIEGAEVGTAPPMAEPWAYRNRLTVRMSGKGPALVSRDDRTLVEIDVCPITHPAVLALLDALDADLPVGMEVVLRAGVRTGDQLILLRDPGRELESLETDAPVSVLLAGPEGMETVAGRSYLVERLRDRTFLIPGGSFFQVNTEMAERLVDEVRSAVPPGTEFLADAYSGVGTFAVCLQDLADEIVAIESDPAAVAAAVENAAGLDHVTLLEGEAAEGLAYLGRRPDVLVVDPPRSGLARSFVRAVADLGPNTIIYVSCEPSTLARDVRQLAAAGWRLDSCRVVDLFPQTFHVETVSVLAR